MFDGLLVYSLLVLVVIDQIGLIPPIHRVILFDHESLVLAGSPILFRAMKFIVGLGVVFLRSGVMGQTRMKPFDMSAQLVSGFFKWGVSCTVT